MAPLPVLAALALAPLAIVATGPLKAEGEPALATTTAGTTDATGAASDTATGTDTSTMPPEYEPCGCRGAGEGGGWAVLALLLTAGSPCRRRRPTS